MEALLLFNLLNPSVTSARASIETDLIFFALGRVTESGKLVFGLFANGTVGHADGTCVSVSGTIVE